MKNVNFKKLSFLLVALLALAGCAEKKETAVSAPAVAPEEGGAIQTTSGTSGTSGPNTSGWGFAAPLTLNCSNFSEFSGRSCSTINFSDTKLYYNIEKIMVNGRAHYKGTMRVYYNYTQTTGGWGSDAGQVSYVHKAPKFESGGTTTDIKFNRIYAQNGKSYMVGFYEEKVWNPQTDTYSDFTTFNDVNNGAFGSIMIVLDGLSEAGYTGKVYFRNWVNNFLYAPKPQSNNERYKCWNITEGPYSCREFVKNGNSTNYNDMLVESGGNAVYNAQYTNLEAPYHYKELGTIGGASTGIVFPE
jgi:hypothetical protein